MVPNLLNLAAFPTRFSLDFLATLRLFACIIQKLPVYNDPPRAPGVSEKIAKMKNEKPNIPALNKQVRASKQKKRGQDDFESRGTSLRGHTVK